MPIDMNPQQQESSPSLSLPAPQTEQAQPMTSTAEQQMQQGGYHEATSAQAMEQPGAALPVAPPMTSQAADPVGVPQPAGQASSAAPSIPMPQIADDADLIEKEWIVKAKQIVEQTAKDPYRQNKEMSKVKADYLKKRYNKDLKVAED